MSIIDNLNTNQWQEHQLPDTYPDAEQYLNIDANFVISRSPEGTIISRYQDDAWNMKMYDAQSRCTYNFVSWIKDASHPMANVISNEMKRIQIARMYLYRNARKPNSINMNPLRKLAHLAMSNGISLSNLFNDMNHNRILLQSYAELSPGPMSDLLKLVTELYTIRSRHSDFTLAPINYSIVERMQAISGGAASRNTNTEQTKLIPSRLYAALIVSLNAELDDFNSAANEIVNLYKRRKSDSLFALSASTYRSYKGAIGWTDAITHLGLDSIFGKRSITNWINLLGYLGETQCTAKYWIHLFTGMRSNEVRHLPADTYQTIKAGGTDVTILRGYTSKLAGGNHASTFWITSSIVEKAIIAARHIGTIAALLNDYDDANLSQYLLFPALSPRGSSMRTLGSAPLSVQHNAHGTNRLLARLPNLIVQEADIRELEQFDGFRDWRNDSDVKIGKVWPLATHQCRRSLAVYCARSGLVSVGSLGLQFKHLTDVMASYYRKGNAFAVNFLNTDRTQNFINELEYERHKAQYVDYEANVIDTTNRLWGGEGNRIQVARDKGQPLIITTDRAMTEKKFLKGEIAYKIGPIGGCTNLDPCDKISFTSIFACIDCDKSILDDDRSLKNIQRGLNNLKRGQSLFVPENPQYKQLEFEISEIYDKLEKRGLRQKMEAMA